MAKRFTKRHTVNGYAAMGNARNRPRYAGLRAVDPKQVKTKK